LVTNPITILKQHWLTLVGRSENYVLPTPAKHSRSRRREKYIIIRPSDDPAAAAALLLIVNLPVRREVDLEGEALAADGTLVRLAASVQLTVKSKE
jgi:inactivated superfamily I helicase